MTAALYVVTYAALSTAGVLLLRASLRDTNDISLATLGALLREPRFVVGFVVYALSFGTWLFALRRFEVTRIFPVFIGAGYCSVVLGAYVFLDEALSASRTVGIAVVLAGIILLSR